MGVAWVPHLNGGGDFPPPVFWLYLFNTASVALNLALQWHFGKARAPDLVLAPTSRWTAA
jgi:hypothetical protein